MGADYRSGTSVNYTTTTNKTFAAPAGIVNGDVLALLFEVGGNPTPPTPTPPSGFTLATGFPLTRSDSNGFTVRTYLWTKTANNESGDYTVSHSNAPSTGFLWAVMGADTANPLTPAPTTQTGLGTTATAPGLTTTFDQTLIMHWVGRWNFPGITPPGGSTPTFTLRNDANNSLLYVASGVLSPQGATGDKVSTGLPQQANEPWASGLIAFKPAGVVRQMEGVSGGRSSAQGTLSVKRDLAGRVAGRSTVQGLLFLAGELLNRLRIDDRTFAVTWEDDRIIEDANWEDGRIIDGASWEDDRIFALPNIGMTKTGVKIKPVAIGDDFRVRRTYTTLPPGVTITKAWFTVKKSEKQADAEALIRKVVTIAPTADGQITDNNTDGGSIAMFFEPNRTETINAKPGLEYVYDVQALASDGKIHTLEKGTIPFILGVTHANS